MNRFYATLSFHCALLLGVSQSAQALVLATSDSLAGADTARSYTLNEVLVTSTRLTQFASLSSSAVTVLSSKDIQSANATSLAQLLSPINGLFIKDYGGNSGLKTIAQRGFGPEHTLLLINGMRVSNAQNSLSDLSLISADEISRVEVLHGGQSASFGADAVAGAVNISTLAIDDAPSVSLLTGLGSFGFKSLQFSGGMAGDVFSIRGSYREERGDENFPFTFRNGNEVFRLTRQNADFLGRTGSLQSHFALDATTHASLFARIYDSERGIGGLVVSPANSSVARQNDEDQLIQLQVKSFHTETLQYRLGVQYHNAYQRYVDTLFFVGASSSDNYFRNVEWRVEPGVELRFGETTRMAVGGEFAATNSDGNSLKNGVYRSTYGVYFAGEHKVATDGALLGELLLYPSLRFDAVRTEGIPVSQWSPQFGVVVPFKRNEATKLQPTVRASVSRNFSAPTFNQLYYAGGGGIGNPHLRPERSTSVDVGCDVAFEALGKHVVRSSYFIIEMNDRIQWVSAGGQSVTPRNIRTVRSEGMEVSYSFASSEELTAFTANYAFTSAKKTSSDFAGDQNINTQLIYVPQETANMSLTISPEWDDTAITKCAATLSYSHVGFRYTTEDNKSFVPSYSLVSANVRTRIAIDGFLVQLRFEVNNIFDKAYQAIQSYPMPGRSYKLTIGVEY